jgi:hypothetical protein
VTIHPDDIPHREDPEARVVLVHRDPGFTGTVAEHIEFSCGFSQALPLIRARTFAAAMGTEFSGGFECDLEGDPCGGAFFGDLAPDVRAALSVPERPEAPSPRASGPTPSVASAPLSASGAVDPEGEEDGGSGREDDEGEDSEDDEVSEVSEQTSPTEPDPAAPEPPEEVPDRTDTEPPPAFQPGPPPPVELRWSRNWLGGFTKAGLDELAQRQLGRSLDTRKTKAEMIDAMLADERVTVVLDG